MIHHDVVGDNRDPNKVVIPPTINDPYEDLLAIVNRKNNSEAINRIISKDEGVDGEAIPMGKLSDTKLK